MFFCKRLPNRCRTGLVYPSSSSGRRWVSAAEASTRFTVACTNRSPWEAVEKGRAEKPTAVQPALIQLFIPRGSGGLYQHATGSTRKKNEILLKVLRNSKSLGARTERADDDIFFAQTCRVFRQVLLFDTSYFLVQIVPGRSKELYTFARGSLVFSRQVVGIQQLGWE